MQVTNQVWIRNRGYCRLSRVCAESYS